MRLSLCLATVTGLTLPLAAGALENPAAKAKAPARTVPTTDAHAGAVKAPAAGEFGKTVRPFLAKHCFGCHNAKARAAGLDLEAFRTEASVVKDSPVWEHVVQKMRTGEMPPKGSPKPPAAGVKAVTGWVEGYLAYVESRMPANPGRVTARRLNRAEYNNTVRDLLGVHFQPADDFPQDDSGYGFDNIGDVLSVSPVLTEKYLNAAEKVARTAIYGPDLPKPSLTRIQPPLRKHDPSPVPKFDYDQSGLTLPSALHLTHRFPADGEYVFRFGFNGTRPGGSEPVKFAVWIDGKQVNTFEFDPTNLASFEPDRQDFSGKRREVRLRVPAGDHWVAATILNLYEGLPARYGGPNPSQRPEPMRRPFNPPPGVNIPPERLAEIRRRFEMRRNEKLPADEVRVTLLELVGPYDPPKGPAAESLRKLYACGHLDGKHVDGCERKIVSSLARRAFRRPVTPEEVEKFVGLVQLARKQSEPFEEGISLAVQAILVSPHFLFRIEREPATAKGAYPISQHELATRLSYFLWSTTPDEALSQCADAGTLRRPEVLRAQVTRMLRDPKAAALVENFAGQWLELRKLESVKPDRDRFGEWDDYLRLSARKETELFFEHLIREDRSILDLIDGRYSFLNERLARFYGVPGVKGPEFRRVDLTGTRRSGVLTQASVLTVSSYATRTSPVLRGKWILENLLNAPPPPPPPGVPTLDETKVGQASSLRAQLEAHRVNPTCASCHVRMDSLGFALENFDAVGGWRDQDGKFPIDSSGALPDGRTMNGPDELKQILKEDRAAFTQCVAEKLLTYALGRGLERYDRPVVKTIARRVAANEYRFSSLVMEIVTSPAFQMRTPVKPAPVKTASADVSRQMRRDRN